MPKAAEYQITWSRAINGYEVRHGPFSFPVPRDETLHYWLDQVETFHFCARSGQGLTVRKERKQRGGGYWYAYKRISGQVQKKYLGRKEEVTLSLLETLAEQFAAPSPEPPSPSPEPPPPSPRVPTLTFTRTLESALSIYGFQTIPDKRSLITRYRELSMQHHPDRGGLHEDMVAINLAYEYLKMFL